MSTSKRRPRATAIVAEESGVVDNVSIEEATLVAETVEDTVVDTVGPKVEETVSENVITMPEHKPNPTPPSNLQPNEEGTLKSGAADRALAKKPEPVKVSEQEKIALHTDRNLHWAGVGHLNRGYNIVGKEASEKWLTQKGVRKATPEELATHFGK